MTSVLPGNLDTTTALIYDSVHAFALALHNLDKVQQVCGQKFVVKRIDMINTMLAMLKMPGARRETGLRWR